MRKLLSAKEMAQKLNISDHQLDQLVYSGMPHLSITFTAYENDPAERSRKGFIRRFSQPAVRLWLAQFEQKEKGSDHATA